MLYSSFDFYFNLIFHVFSKLFFFETWIVLLDFVVQLCIAVAYRPISYYVIMAVYHRNLFSAVTLSNLVHENNYKVLLISNIWTGLAAYPAILQQFVLVQLTIATNTS